MTGQPVRAVAFVRNVMVGRQGLTRQVLLEAFERAGAEAPRSYLATGNVTFTAVDPLDGGLVAQVEDAIEAVLGRREPVFVCPVRRLAALVAADPFRAAPDADPHERCVSFLPQALRDRELPLPLSSRRDDVTVFARDGAEVFSVTRLVGGRPGTAGRLLEAALDAPVTTRNWRTVSRIVNDHG